MNNLLDKDQMARLRKYCAVAESRGALTPALLEWIYKEKWLKLFVPVAYGGLQMNLPEALRVEERLAYIDGSLGWTVTLCAGANLFAGYLGPQTAARVFASKKVCFGGSGAIGGTAEQVGEGYRINGFWKYATGAPHLTHFTANCYVLKDGQPLLDEEGVQVVRSFFFKRREVTIHQAWDTMGLKATAGHSFSVKDLRVGRDRSFLIEAQQAKSEDPIYQYPFLPFAEATIAVNTLGMTRHFLELAATHMEQRRVKLEGPVFHQISGALQSVEEEVTRLSESFYEWADRSWQALLRNGKLPPQTQRKIGATSRQLVGQCRSGVAQLYPYCGLAATGQGSQINRVFRDIFTASQHGLLSFPRS